MAGPQPGQGGPLGPPRSLPRQPSSWATPLAGAGSGSSERQGGNLAAAFQIGSFFSEILNFYFFLQYFA